MRVDEIMTPKVETVSPDISIQEAARLMRDLNIGCLAVTSGIELRGVITDRDICCRIVSKGLDPATATVNDAMSANAVCCYRDQDIAEMAQLMEDKCVRRLAVLDRNRDNEMVGFVSVDDLARYANALAGEVLAAASPVAERGGRFTPTESPSDVLP